MLDLAAKCVIDSANASTSIIQRRLKIGYARAGKLLDELEQLGVVGPHQGAKPRDVLVTYKEWEIIYNELPAEKETVIDDDSHDNDYSVLSDAEIRKMIAETPSVSEIYKTKFGIDIDYSDDGFFIDKLENSIFPNTNDSVKELFITNIVTYASPDIPKLNEVDIMEGRDFENFTDDLLRSNGFMNISVTPSSGDIFDKSSAVMIGDREHDIIGANENGYVSVGNGISDIHEIKSSKEINDEMTKDYCK